MQMYSREEMMEEMGKQESMKSEDKQFNQYPGGDLSILETIIQTLRDIWNWIQNLLGIRNKVSDEL